MDVNANAEKRQPRKLGPLSDPSYKYDHHGQKLEFANCWRQLKVKMMMLSGDGKLIDLLRQFGLYDGSYAKMEGLELFSSREESPTFSQK
ncbi:hypothetical protein N7505_007760 [Penicillium chrysogenum]|uniref:Uncharacterized protein n=1 Tax=Penicillium chrysogenum TaxID=5076 RepID=A0ABQ8WEA5_PENCH|nr:hypothetical protein N7505_007760 [Penicillium chrysogenum]